MSRGVERVLTRVLGVDMTDATPIVVVGVIAGRLRGLLPVPLMRALATLRARLAWRSEAVRADARKQMAFLLEKSDPGADIEAAARRYVWRQALRGELRWHPSVTTSMTIVGYEHLDTAIAHGRGVVFNWMHHGTVEATAKPMSDAGYYMRQVGADKLFGALPAWLRQHLKIAAMGGSVMVNAAGGSEALRNELKNGHTLSIAIDVAGRTPMRWLGRDLVGSFGAPRFAMETGAPVVIMTAELLDEKDLLPFVRIHPPLWPEDYADARELLDAMLALHEPYVVKWPELYDIPLSHWGFPPSAEDAS
jgi:lauroyl/myristoyl acyltransferase